MVQRLFPGLGLALLVAGCVTTTETTRTVISQGAPVTSVTEIYDPATGYWYTVPGGTTAITTQSRVVSSPGVVLVLDVDCRPPSGRKRPGPPPRGVRRGEVIVTCP